MNYECILKTCVVYMISSDGKNYEKRRIIVSTHTHTHTKYGTITEDTTIGVLEAVCYT